VITAFSKGRKEWIEAQAQAVAKEWSGDWKIPGEMLPRVQQLRKEAKQRAEIEATIRLAILLAVLILLAHLGFCTHH
jgi:hypothetical protein